MKPRALRAACLVVAILVAGAGLLPCACAGMSSAAGGSAHCGGADPGLRAASEGCACACMRALAAEAGQPTSLPAVASGTWAPPTPYSYVARLDSPFPPAALDVLGDSPPLPPPLVLRV